MSTEASQNNGTIEVVQWKTELTCS